MPRCHLSKCFIPSTVGLEPRYLMTAHPGIRHAVVSILAAPTGLVTKKPEFSADYLGPHRANLNLMSASAKLAQGRTLTLSATVVGKIIARPRDASTSSFFVFGLDRGSPHSFALFPNRPGIRFDSVVVATITPEGLGGYVLDVHRDNAQTNLSPSQMRISGRTVRVSIADDLLKPPEDSKPASQMRFSVWSRSRIEHTLADIDDYVASFLPNNGSARIAVVKPRG
jgi:hypothetical protein